MNIEPQFPSNDLNASIEEVTSSENNHVHSSQNIPIDLNQLPEEDDILFNGNVESNLLNQPRKKKKNFSNAEKVAIFEMLLIQHPDNGKLPRGVLSKVANAFSISIRSVSRIWREGKSTMNRGVPLFPNKLLNRRHRKRIEIDFEQMKNIPFRHQTNIRSLSKALNLSKTTVHRRIKDGNIRPHSNPVKPCLSDDNIRARLEFCLSMVDQESTITSRPIFINMHDHIHIDEKWFYLTKTCEKYYLHADEIEPFRTCKSKSFITKIMFLDAVARPRFDETTGDEFNGKIGIWPFVSHEPAKRRSKNRAAGTLETKPETS
ncbi:uncharacterized protein [Henckelia pumila]|uniref:uncharacterized protein n=1 Tax=Henckelia pumila TaxID=405737 RepID=UPI003C6DB831